MAQELSNLQHTLQEITRILDSKKAENIEIIDLCNTEYFCDYVVIATAMSGKHALSLLNYLKEELKAQAVVFYAVDEKSEDWIIIDLGEIIIHIFTTLHREKYNLEEFLQTNFKIHADNTES